MSGPDGLTPHADVVDLLATLPVLLRDARLSRRLSIRAAARQLGVCGPTVSRIEAGGDCLVSNAVAVLRWLDRPSVGQTDSSGS